MPVRLARQNILALLGLLLSLYAVYVEHKVEHHRADEEESFTALCDIDAIGASCSTVFTLPVGRMLSFFGLVPEGSFLDVPNAVLGVLYYTWLLLLIDLVPEELTQAIAVAAFGSTVFLAYQLTFVLFELCILCWTTHVINSLLLYRLVLRPCKVKTV